MTIRTRSTFTRTASEIIEEVLNICAGTCPDELNKKIWRAVVLERKDYVLKRDEDQGIGTPVISAKLRIERIPQGFFDKLLRLFLGSVGVTIVIPPVHSRVKIHSVGVDIVFGDRRIDKRRNIVARVLYQKDLEQALSTLKKKVPELNLTSVQ